jgi:5-methylcytosine-specific restriction endonuclease McrA
MDEPFYAAAQAEIRATRLSAGHPIDLACIIPPSAPLLDAAQLFREAVGRVLDRDVSGARRAIRAMDEEALWNAYDAAQGPGKRTNRNGTPRPSGAGSWLRLAAALDRDHPPTARSDGARRSSGASKSSLERAVFERDAYHCRYCAIPVAPWAVIDRLRRIVGDDVLWWGPKNRDQHGGAQIFTAVTDHVYPWRYGGADDLTNLVTSCGICNYAKWSYTPAALGLADPFGRPPVSSPWKGGTELLVMGDDLG